MDLYSICVIGVLLGLQGQVQREITNSCVAAKVVAQKRASNFSRYQVVATAYTLGEGSGTGRTSTGKRPKEGRTIAVDPRLIPYGSKVFVVGHGWRIAEDTGGKIRGRRIDVFFRYRRDALRFGRRRLSIAVHGRA